MSDSPQPSAATRRGLQDGPAVPFCPPRSLGLAVKDTSVLFQMHTFGVVLSSFQDLESKVVACVSRRCWAHGMATHPRLKPGPQPPAPLPGSARTCQVPLGFPALSCLPARSPRAVLTRIPVSASPRTHTGCQCTTRPLTMWGPVSRPAT